MPKRKSSGETNKEEVEEVARQLYTSPIAQPLLSGKMQTKSIRLVRKLSHLVCENKKAVKNVKHVVKRGIPETIKAIKKGSDNHGIVLLAADVFPVDVFAHVPIICEENKVVYAYVPSRKELGNACGTKRPATCVYLNWPKNSLKSLVKKDFVEEAETIYTSAEKLRELIVESHPYM